MLPKAAGKIVIDYQTMCYLKTVVEVMTQCQYLQCITGDGV